MNIRNRWKLSGVHFSRNGVFSRTALLILSMLLMLMLAFLAVLYSVMFHTMQRSVLSSNRAVLEKTVSLADATMTSIMNAVDGLCWNEAVVRVLVNPSFSNSQQNFEAAETLRRFVSTTSYASFSALVVNQSGAVHTSSDGVYTLSVQSNIGRLCTAPPVCVLYGDWLDLVRDGEGALFLRYRVIPGYRGYLGTLLIKLETQDLFQSICGGEAQMYVTTADAVLLLGGTPGLLPPPDSGAAGVRKAGSGQVLLWETSSYSGLRFLYQYPEVAFAPMEYLQDQSISLALKLLLPLLVILPLIAAWLLNRPMRKIMRGIKVPVGREDMRSLNEWALLNTVITDLNAQNKLFDRLLSEVSGDILRKLILDLLLGIPLSESHINQVLAGLNLPLEEQGDYLLFLARNRATGVFRTEELDRAVERMSNLVYQSCLFFPVSYQYSILTLVRLDDACARVPEKAAEEILWALSVYANGLPDNVVSHSAVFYHLRDLPKARAQAADEAHCGIMAQNPKASLSIEGQIRRSVQALPEQSREAGLLTLVNLIENLKKTPDVRPCHWEQFLQALRQLAVEYGLKAEYLPNFSDIPGAQTSPEACVQAVERCSAQLVHEIFDQLEKRGHKYLTQARAYVEAHYTDCNLSLEQVAACVGISASYLSKLFTDAFGIRFTQHLSKLRVGRAKELLANEALLLYDVGRQSGFLTVQNFMRVFKQQTGLTPGEYRSLLNRRQPE